MKKLYYLMAISCMFLSLPLTSCSDDDDDDVTPVVEEENGHTTGSKNLTGALTVVVGSTTMEPYYQDLTVKDDYANGTLEIYIEDFTFSFVGQSIAFGELNVKCNYTDGDNFEGSTTVTYGGDIDFTVEGTYDGTDLEFSSSFEVVGQTISFKFSTKQTITEGDETEGGETMPEFEVPENAVAYTGTLSGDAMSGVAKFEEESTIYYNGSVFAIEKFALSVLGFDIELENMYMNIEPDAEGNFTNGTATAWMFGEYYEMEGVEGQIVVDGDDITAQISLTVEALGMTIDVNVNFTTVEGGEDDEQGEDEEIGEEGDEEIDYTIVSTPSEYTGTLSGTYKFIRDTNIEPISNVEVSVGENAKGETIVALDSEFTVSVVTIKGLSINCGTLANDGSFTGTVSIDLGTSTTEVDITGTITVNGDDITIEASFSYAVDLTVKFTTTVEAE